MQIVTKGKQPMSVLVGRQLAKHHWLAACNSEFLICNYCAEFIRISRKDLWANIRNHAKKRQHKHNLRKAEPEEEMDAEQGGQEQPKGQEETQNSPSPELSNLFDDIDPSGFASSPLLATLFEEIKGRLGNPSTQLEPDNYELIKGLFDTVLEQIRNKVGDRRAGLLLMNFMTKIRSIKTANDNYCLMLRL